MIIHHNFYHYRPKKLEELKPHLIGDWCVVPEPTASKVEFTASIKTDAFALVVSKIRNEPNVFDIQVVLGDILRGQLSYQTSPEESITSCLNDIHRLVLQHYMNDAVARLMMFRENGGKVN